MLQIEKNKFKENAKYLVVLFLILLVLIVFSLMFGKKENISKIEVDLTENGSSKVSKLVINEISNNNDGSFADIEGNIYDWVEIYNGSNKDIDLSNYSLSDEENTIEWIFNDVTIKSKSYIVVYLTGETKEGLYANFKLNKNGGEKLVLMNPSGKVVDAVETVKTNKNTSLARNLDGKWEIVKNVTPGFINTKEGYKEFLDSINLEDTSIVINEVLVKNGGQFIDDYNDYSGYIELKNTTDKKISLKNYSLSDEINEPFKWKLPDIELKPNEIIMIYTSGRDVVEGILHTSFNLDGKKGNIILSKNGGIVQTVEYSNLPNGYALSLIDGEFKQTGILTGGYENNISGSEEFAKKYQKNKNTLIINEVMNSNFEYLAQNGAEYYDWIEIKNNSDKEINIKDYYLTTTLNDFEMYKLPDVILEPNEYYVIMASGDEKLSNSSYKHSNFKLSDVESLYLINDNKIVDSMFISDIPLGYSFGKKNDYGFIYMEEPSPKEENNSGKYEVAYSPEFSVKSGVYNDVESMKIEIKAPGTIYYTLNGDNPTKYSKIYEEPIVLEETTIVRAISVEEGKFSSDIITASYVINENHTLPVVSVVLDNYDYYRVISRNWGTVTENAYAEYFEEGKDGFSIPCGFKLFGGTTRDLEKKSFSLKFQKRYGESELHYQVFENRDNSIYNTLVLRSGSQDYSESMIRDSLMTSIMEDTEVDVQAMKPVILYINGEYWGIYYLIEKVDEDFVSAHYNVDPDGTNIVRIDGEVMVGSSKSYRDLINYMNNHNMANDEHYEYVKQYLDIDNLITYWIAETFVTNNDIVNCRFFSNPNIDDGKWHFIFYDLDFGMYYYRVNYYDIMTDPLGMGSMRLPSALTRNLFKNEQFRQRFVEILSEMLETTWTEERLLNKIDELYEKLLPEMPRNQKRWGLSMSNWEKNIEDLREFAKNRKSYLLRQTKSFFKLSNEEMKEYFDYEV